MDQLKSTETQAPPQPKLTGRREIALACSSRPISNANEYYLNHGTITRIYAKVSKKTRAAARRKERTLNASTL